MVLSRWDSSLEPGPSGPRWSVPLAHMAHAFLTLPLWYCTAGGAAYPRLPPHFQVGEWPLSTEVLRFSELRGGPAIPGLTHIRSRHLSQRRRGGRHSLSPGRPGPIHEKARSSRASDAASCLGPWHRCRWCRPARVGVRQVGGVLLPGGDLCRPASGVRDTVRR